MGRDYGKPGRITETRAADRVGVECCVEAENRRGGKTPFMEPGVLLCGV